MMVALRPYDKVFSFTFFIKKHANFTVATMP